MKYYWILFLISILALSCGPKNRTIKTVKGTQINTSKIDSFISTQIDSAKLVGVSVSIVNGNKIVYSGHFGKKKMDGAHNINNKSIYQVASLSKPVFSFFVLKQVEKGILQLDEPLYRYLPNPDISYDERYKTITARMVLCHSSGFPNWRRETNDSLKLNIPLGLNTAIRVRVTNI
ncbi:serine hydrolase domain-containing protein [uncultured Croceitalea sp.]|uniref:serine hydrolase domain-containing protein n=1 Tax=uncultured Croceitalea sp. TaxID=1798908 RepID=UPI00374F8E5A